MLLTRGVEQTREDCTAYDNSPDDYDSGAKKFDSDRKIYGAKSVKNALLRAQHDKCCYCESTFRSTSYGAVEHYRPKGSVKQALGQPESYPGYYWLAYDWSNLLVSCEVCNTSYKGILFPLVDHETRARSHHDQLDLEQPLFINPAIDDPRSHIRFRGETPEPRSDVGRVTIQSLGLRRSELEEDRRERLAELMVLRDVVELQQNSTDPNIQDLVQQAQDFLASAILPQAEYSSMAQDFLESNG
jgi:uncharacterized protein (TIGR02646 family)